MAGIGGIFGAVVRYLLGKWIANLTDTIFPIGTWTINVTGSFALGFTFILFNNDIIVDWVWMTLGIGFLGAYTTFSTFGYETIGLLEKKQWTQAFLYIISSVLLGILFAWLGTVLGGKLV